MANPPSCSSSADNTTSHRRNSLKGKRKKAIPVNANPLFTKWLTEWKDEAASKGWKSHYIYSKALRTLKMFPLCLETGKDCKLLQNFGDKICRMLDEKLLEHKQNQAKELGSEDSPTNTLVTSITKGSSKDSSRTASMPIHEISDNSDSGGGEAPSSQKKKKKTTENRRQREYVPAYRSGPYALILTMYKYSQVLDYKGFLTKLELTHAAQSLSDKSFTTPEAGSHYTAWSSMGSLIKRGLIAKSGSPARYSLTQSGFELGERLQNVNETGENDTSSVFTDKCKNCTQNSQGPSSSLKTTSLDHLDLSQEEKEFIFGTHFGDKKSVSVEDDAVYIVSDDELNNYDPVSHVTSNVFKAHSISPSSTPSPVPCVKETVKPSAVKSSVLSNEISIIETDVINSDFIMESRKNEDSNDEISDVCESFERPGVHTRQRSLSPTSISPQNYSYHQPSTSSTSIQVPESSVSVGMEKRNNLSGNRVDDVIEIDDEDDDILLNERNRRKNMFDKIDRNFSSQVFCDDGDELPDLDFDIPLSKRLFSKGSTNSQLLLSHMSSKDLSSNTKVVNPPKSSDKHCDLTSESFSSNKKPLTVSESSSQFTAITSKDIEDISNRNKNENRDIIQPKLPTSLEHVDNHDKSNTLLETHPDPLFTLYPGTFEIVLCIDNREFYGSKSNSKTLLPDLMQRGVNCDLRLLHISDVLWVAREKIDSNDDSARKDRKELVLNFAIERKRMDDLVSSMTGGRLKEQKFRLRHCGVSELIILIEEFGSIQNFSISEDRIKQSIVNSQILDGFKVKRCGSSKEAVSYLATMTRFIVNYYSNKILHASTYDYVKARSPKSSVRDKDYFLMPFEMFNEMSVKQKVLTVNEMFGKHLIQIPGISLERAFAITKVYPTLASLMKAYGNCTSEKSKESLLSTIKCGIKERNLGIALSRVIYMLYNKTSYLSF